jgi:hypothetical protein
VATSQSRTSKADWRRLRPLSVPCPSAVEGPGTLGSFSLSRPRNPPTSSFPVNHRRRKSKQSGTTTQPIAESVHGEAQAHRAVRPILDEPDWVIQKRKQNSIHRLALNRLHRKQQQFRKRKVRLPRKERNERNTKTNLGIVAAEMQQLTKQHVDSLLSKFKQCLKKKDDRSYAMMSRLGTLLVGSIFRTEYVYQGCQPYCGYVPGYVRVLDKPSFFATRLIIEQILHCRNNAPIRLIEKVINQQSCQ